MPGEVGQIVMAGEVDGLLSMIEGQSPAKGNEPLWAVGGRFRFGRF